MPSEDNLHLTLTAHLKVDGRDTPWTITTFAKSIQVAVTATQPLPLLFCRYLAMIIGGNIGG